MLTWSSRTEEGRKGLDVQELGKPCMTSPLRGGQALVTYMHNYMCIQLQCGLVGSGWVTGRKGHGGFCVREGFFKD